MPKDYDPAITPPTALRRPERGRDDDWIRGLLRRAQTGYLATRWDDQPFIKPTSFWYDEERHEIVFHGATAGRTRANLQRHGRACFAVSECGRYLPSNTAMEFSVQYAGAVVFGTVRTLTDPAAQRRALHGLIRKHFPELEPGKAFRPATDQELAATEVYALAVASWSGKENWKQQAGQSADWLPLPDARPGPADVAFQFVEKINRGDLAGLVALMTEEHTFVDLAGEVSSGRELMRRGWAHYFDRCPEYMIHVWQYSVVGDCVALRGSTTGSHLNLPREEEFADPLIWVARIEAGQVAEWRLLPDTPAVRSQWMRSVPA